MAMLADYQLEMDGQTLIVKAFGNWTIEQAGQLDGRLSLDVGKLTYSIVNYDMSEIEDLDTSGAYLLARAQFDMAWPRRKVGMCLTAHRGIGL